MQIRDLEAQLLEITPSEERYIRQEKHDYSRFSALDNRPDTFRFKLKDIAFSDHEDLQFFIRKQSRFTPVPKHTTDVIEINYMYQGESHHLINDRPISLQEGDLIIIDTQSSHEVQAVDYLDLVISINVSQNFFKEHFFKKLDKGSSLSHFLFKAISTSQNHNQFLLFKKEEGSKVHQLMQELLMEVYDPSPMSAHKQELYLQLILLEILEHFSLKDNQVDDKTDQHQLLLDILAYMEKHYVTTSLEDMAKHFGYNSAYFSSLYKKLTGTSFKKALQEKRLQASLPLLRLSLQPIREIAQDVGFSNINQYYKCFQDKHGQSPAAYRKAHGKHSDKSEQA